MRLKTQNRAASLVGAGLLVALVACSAFLLVYNLSLSIPYNKFLWERVEPQVYYMEVTTGDTPHIQVQRGVLVENGEIVSISILDMGDPLERYSDWFDPNDLTIEGIFDSAREWCVPDDECVLAFDADFHYLRLAGTSWRGIRIDKFVPCEQADTCRME